MLISLRMSASHGMLEVEKLEDDALCTLCFRDDASQTWRAKVMLLLPRHRYSESF
ncbi:hypothetical protein LEMLEM_LOCUS15552, partial [Lemmus lemmus]